MSLFKLCRAWFKIIVSMTKCPRSTLFYAAIAFLYVGRWFVQLHRLKVAEGCLQSWEFSPPKVDQFPRFLNQRFSAQKTFLGRNLSPAFLR